MTTTGSADGRTAFLSFSLGPVQSFIVAAHTVRDLWTGSYLLSWLTYHAMRPVLELERQGAAAFVSPDLGGSPLRRWYEESRNDVAPDDLLAPCLPNRFLAEVPAEAAGDLARECECSCRTAWRRAAKAVHERLAQEIDRANLPHRDGWDRLWQDQVDTFFEIRTAVLRWGDCGEDAMRKFLGDGEGDLWGRRWRMVGGLLEAKKMTRHYPAYRAEGDVPGKCSLLGTLEQMGPATLAQSREFWEQFAGRVRVGGTGVRKRERLCAVSLVKRFAWPAFFAREEYGERFHGDTKALRYQDTATVAATVWLDAEPRLNPDEVRHRHDDWSGQWLHWPSPGQGAEEGERDVPPEVWEAIQRKRRGQGKPPTYYAVLMIDGDKMGEKLRGGGRERHGEISRALAGFALKTARAVVEKGHHGELIYAGGDDVLALLPTQTAVACARELSDACARELSDAFRKQFPMPGADRATVSAGLAVVHHKEDLRFALNQARRAEKAAKDAGRDALVLQVCKRSGGHSTALLPWSYAQSFEDLVQAFLPDGNHPGASDRWAYHLAGELPTLEGLARDAVAAEVRRLVKRTEESGRKRLGGENTVTERFMEYVELVGPGSERALPLPEATRNWVTLCQAASFLARGREE